MTEQEILSNLCAYDERNPNYNDRDKTARRNIVCHCDNCFYGRTKMAEYILQLRQSNSEIDKNLQMVDPELPFMKAIAKYLKT